MKFKPQHSIQIPRKKRVKKTSPVSGSSYFSWKLGLFMLIGGVSLCVHLISMVSAERSLYATTPQDEKVNDVSADTPVAEPLVEENEEVKAGKKIV